MYSNLFINQPLLTHCQTNPLVRHFMFEARWNPKNYLNAGDSQKPTNMILFKIFTTPLTWTYFLNRCNKLFYSDSGRTSRTRSRRRVYLGQLPARENIQNNSSTTQNIHHHSSSTAHIISSSSSSKITSISKINDTAPPSSRIRTVTSLPAYEDCVKTSLSDLEDNNNDDCDESILDSTTTTTMRITHKEAKKLDFLRNSGMDNEKM